MMAIKVNIKVMALMFDFWQVATDREKVGELSIMTIAGVELKQWVGQTLHQDV